MLKSKTSVAFSKSVTVPCFINSKAHRLLILNEYSDYKGKSKKDWDNQPGENFPGIRLIKWMDKNEK